MQILISLSSDDAYNKLAMRIRRLREKRTKLNQSATQYMKHKKAKTTDAAYKKIKEDIKKAFHKENELNKQLREMGRKD